MKKITSLILCIVMLASCMGVWASADDSIVSYALAVKATFPADGAAYAVGETLTATVAVSTKNADGGDDVTPAPIYAFNGVLNYNSFLLDVVEIVVPTAFATMVYADDPASGKVSFSYLCPALDTRLQGVKVSADFMAVQVKFKALKNGTSALILSDLVFTDKDAGVRPIIANMKLDICIGDGQTVSDASTLSRGIEDAKKELGSAVMNPTDDLIYPAFTVSRAAYDALDAAIKDAEKALASAKLADEFLEAEQALLSAVHAYEAAKLYGRDPAQEDDENALIEVTAFAGEHGRIEGGYDSQLVRYGTSATVIAVPEKGYETVKVVVNGVEYPGDDTVTVASVTQKVHIEFYFAEKPRFTDVKRGAWYFEAVEKIAEMGLFAGTSETQFSPNAAMTRAMLVTVLHRLDGKPAASKTTSFSDVAADTWYTEAIAWASENGIVNGYTNGTFGVNDSISRQDAVTVLYRYLAYKGITPAEGAALDAYTDASRVSGYAKPAMEWAYATGLVKGTSDTTLSPKDSCSRAQVATIILRYTENIAAK